MRETLDRSSPSSSAIRSWLHPSCIRSDLRSCWLIMIRECAICTISCQGETHSQSGHNAHMSDDLRPESAKRLEIARKARGFDDAAAAARYFGWKYNAYIQHERGERGLSRAAAKYAKAFHVSVGWLLHNEPGGPDIPQNDASEASSTRSLKLEELRKLIPTLTDEEIALALSIIAAFKERRFKPDDL